VRLPLAVDEGMVDRDGAELILDDRDAQPVFVGRQHAVDQRRFPTAEEARHDRDWHVTCRSGWLGAAISLSRRAIAASRYGLAQLERLAFDSLKAAALQEVHEDLRENKGADDHGGDHPGIQRTLAPLHLQSVARYSDMHDLPHARSAPQGNASRSGRDADELHIMRDCRLFTRIYRISD
jgi:hypothetical protein